MRNDKVIHVELKEPYQGKQHYYFGSKAAIYQVLPVEVVGIKLESLWSHRLTASGDVIYRGKKAVIRTGELVRQPGGRFRHNKQ